MQMLMATKRKPVPAPVEFGEDASLGERLARFRKARGFTQQELADRVGIIQVLVSDYERGKLRITAELAIRFAQALQVSTDEFLGVTEIKSGKKTSRKILRRLEQIDSLRPQQQAVLLKTIDTFLRGATK